MEQIENKLLKTSEAAKILNVTSTTIRNLVKQNKLKAVRVGNREQILKSEIDRILAS